MAIDINATFGDLGKVFAAFANINGLAGLNDPVTSNPTWGTSGPFVKSSTGASGMYPGIESRVTGTGLQSILPTIQSLSAIQGIDNALNTAKQALIADAGVIVVKRVNADVQQPDNSTLTALKEFIRQMQNVSQTVKNCTVSQAVSASAGNTGNNTTLCTLTDPNGLTLENALQETIIARCTTDRFHGATAGSETFTITSPIAVNPTTSYLWPGGSGLTTTQAVVDPTLGNGSGTNANLLTGDAAGGTATGAFKAFTGSVPTAWVADVDSGNISDGTSNNYAGTAHCLQFTGNTSGTNLQTAVYQNFANGAVTGGAVATLLPGTVYHFHAKVKASVVPAAGTLSISLTDGSGNVLNNNQSVANTITVIVSGFGSTSYQTVTGSFQTPTVMPTNARLRIKATTQITTGTNVFIDFVALTQAPSVGQQPIGGGGSSSGYGGLYAGGPYVTIFRGSTDPINWVSPTIGDQYSIAITNNYGSSSPTPLSFQTLFGLFFSLPQNALILPSASNPTYANSLIG